MKRSLIALALAFSAVAHADPKVLVRDVVEGYSPGHRLSSGAPHLAI